MVYPFSDRMNRFSTSAVRDILKWTQGRDIISFAGGLPAEELFPIEAVRLAFERVLSGTAGRSLQYGLTEGFLPLREQLSLWMEGKGITVTPDQMILTTGSQQAIDLTARIFLNEGDRVAAANPTYLSAIQVFQSNGASVIGVACDEEGIDPVQLEEVFRRDRPKLLYAIPTFDNPTGGIWSMARRTRVLELCRTYGVIVLEDDPYGELRFTSDEEAPLPSLFQLAQSEPDSPVIYTSTFSKTVAPALRSGWALADSRIIRQLAKAKQAADLHSSILDQQALCELMKSFDLRGHIAHLRQEYGARMLAMEELLHTDAIWKEAQWRRPSGGMFFWLELPSSINTEALFPIAIEENVAFVPGSGFFPNVATTKRNAMRLNFSHSSPERIKAGMERLTVAYRRYLTTTGSSPGSDTRHPAATS